MSGVNPDAAREAHEILVKRTDLYENIIDTAGEYDAKLDSAANCSLAAHILNAVTIGVNTFVYNAVGEDESVSDYEEDIRVLAAALALHDTNKYVQEAHGVDVDGNTQDTFDWYFDPDLEDADGDPFGIDEFLGVEYRDDLIYLVQRTELTEDSSGTRGQHSDFGGLARYCRIGDAVASVALKQGIEGAHEKLTEILDEKHVHLVRFTELEQPILNDVLLGSTKEVIAGETNEAPAYGVVIGSSPDGVLYLGDEIEQTTLYEGVSERAPERIATDFRFDCKMGWNTFDYDILQEIEIPLDRKKERIIEQGTELLLSDSGRDEGMEYVPDDFQQYLPALFKSVYLDEDNDYHTEELNEVYQSEYDSIDGGPSAKGQKVKIRFIQALCQEYEKYRDDLEVLKQNEEPELHADLKPETDAIGEVIDRFFEGQTLPDIGSKGEMCFLCGTETDTKYQKGISGVYRTQEFSRRVPPHAKYKSICEVCNLEYALLADVCERSDVSTNNAIEVAYFYFDDFLGDIRLRSRRVGNVVQGDSDEMDDREVTTSLFGPQYYLQPVYVMDENHRMAIVRQVLETAQESGMKVVIGRPFTRFESADAVFTDEEATRPQELLGLDRAERFGPLPNFAERQSDSHLRRAIQLFRIMSMVGQEANMTNPYLHLDRDTFHSIADFAVVNHDHATRLETLRSYFENYHEDALMDMKTVAERGIDLFGQQYDSKYKKTKVFREALDAFLSGKSQRMDEDDLVDYVESQVYAAADREDYAGHATPDEAAAFVDAIHSYLVDNDLYDLKKLSDWEDALVNSYYYAYEQALQDR